MADGQNSKSDKLFRKYGRKNTREVVRQFESTPLTWYRGMLVQGYWQLLCRLVSLQPASCRVNMIDFPAQAAPISTSKRADPLNHNRKISPSPRPVAGCAGSPVQCPVSQPIFCSKLVTYRRRVIFPDQPLPVPCYW